MKGILARLLVIVVLIGCFIGLDIVFGKIKNKPLIVLSKDVSEETTIYHGLFYDGYECHLCDARQLIKKDASYECSNENHEKRLSLTLVGDLLFEQPYYDDLELGTSRDLYFNRVKKYFINDDLTIGNMEVPIGNDSMEVSGEGYNFCAPEWVGDLVAGLDFEVLSTANNHAFDREIEGIHSTLDYFENNSDILMVGTFRNLEERKKDKILNINGINVGFLAYTYATNIDPEEEDVDLIGYYRNARTYKLTEEAKAKVENEVTSLRKKCDVLVVMMHWGNEFTYEVNSEQEKMAHFLNELGVDLIVGGHSHNIQPIEMIGDEHQTLCYYSLGNFVSADEDLDRTYNDETFDNAYQVGMLSKLDIVYSSEGVSFENIQTEMIVNYFDQNARSWELVPLNEYTKDYERTHQRFYLGLTKEFIEDMHESVIDEKYR